MAAGTMNGRTMNWMERCEAARSVPILELVQRLQLGEPKKSGKQLTMLCPFHGERSPSFNIDPGRGLWNCFGCDAGGDAIGLWMKDRRVGFAQAVREIVP